MNSKNVEKGHDEQYFALPELLDIHYNDIDDLEVLFDGDVMKYNPGFKN